MWTRRAALALLLGAALGLAAPADAQVRRPGKKGIVEQPGPRRRPAMGAEDYIMRLVEMPPERRRELLNRSPRFRRLPEPERKRILARLKQIDEMPSAEREQLLERYHLFSRLPPEKRERARELYRDWTRLPAERRRMMTRAVGRLRAVDPSQRAKALESEEMTSRFDEKELALIREIVDLAPAPPAGPNAR
jgi:hypothetical protein